MANENVETYGDLRPVEGLTVEAFKNLVSFLDTEERKFEEVIVVFKDDTVSAKPLYEKIDEITPVEGIYITDGCVCCLYNLPDDPTDDPDDKYKYIQIHICVACRLFLETGKTLSMCGQKGCHNNHILKTYNPYPYKHLGVNLGIYSCSPCDEKTFFSVLNVNPNRQEIKGRLAKVNEDELESRLIEIYPYNGSSLKSATKLEE
jgi:hypothetical protein